MGPGHQCVHNAYLFLVAVLPHVPSPPRIWSSSWVRGREGPPLAWRPPRHPIRLTPDPRGSFPCIHQQTPSFQTSLESPPQNQMGHVVDPLLGVTGLTVPIVGCQPGPVLGLAPQLGQRR
uniref:Phosphoprotein n=1 Tax=Hepatitis E virus TaxID=1678143 RepID=A0A191UMV0_HEV|nr:phosphoprotein [Hepatitis E virus]